MSETTPLYTITAAGGMKEEKGKTDWTLFPWKFADRTCRVMMYGADKYSRFNWELVPVDEYVKAALRHIISYLGGETVDPESGHSHLSHAACDILYAGQNATGKQLELDFGC